MSLGSLVVSLGLDAAQFVRGLTDAEARAKRFGRTVSNDIAVGIIKAEVAMRALGEAFTFVARAIPDLARQAGNFQDIAEKVGTNAESLAGFQVALHVTGKSADDLGDFMVKLGKNLVGVEDGTDKAGAALQALGLDVNKFKALDPAEKIDALSKALDKFSNQGEGKANVLEALGKGGAALLPFLKELNEEGGRQTILTKEQIRLADAYSDASARASAQLNLYAQVAASKVLPAITDVKNAAKELIKELFGIGNAGSALAEDKSIETWADKTAKALAFVIDSGDGVTRVFQLIGTTIAAQGAIKDELLAGRVKGALSIVAQTAEEIEKIVNRPFFSEKLEEARNKRQFSGDVFGFKTSTEKKPLVFNGAQPDTGKSLIDGQIKALESAIAREKDLLGAREAFLRDTFQVGKLSVVEYYASLQAARDNELRNVLGFMDQQIAAEAAFAKRAKPGTDRQAAEQKVNDLTEKRARIVLLAGFQEDQLARDRARDADAYIASLNEINAQILEIAGNSREAAAIRFDAQNKLIRDRALASGDTGAVAQLDAIKAQQGALADLANAQRKYSNSVEITGIALSRIELLAQTGAITEIDAINARAEAARRFVPILNAQADAAERFARTLADGPAKDAALIQVQKLRLEIEQLASATDVLAKKFNDIFSGAIADGITALVEGTKSLKDVLKDVGKSISTQITQIAAKQVSDTLFAKGGALGGVGDFFAGIFGGKSGDSTLSSAGTTLITAGVGLQAAAVAIETAAVALTASAGGNAFSSAFGKGSDPLGEVLKLFGAVPTFAAGGRPPIGRASIIGEHGPELWIPDTSGTVVSNDELQRRRAARFGGGDMSVNVYVPEGTSRASADQIAVQTGRRIQIAQRKKR